MKWFDRWFYNRARWAWKRAGYEYPELKSKNDILDRAAEDEYENGTVVETIHCDSDDSSIHGLYDGMRIDIKKLRGGYVVTFRHPQDSSSKYVNDPLRTSHIITDDDDFHDRLVKLLTMELLKQ
jgi:hypothetical protein